jgi:hypothetical protein
MDLAGIKAAIAETERAMTRLRKQIDHREAEAAKRMVEAGALKRELAEAVDRYVSLVAEEQKIERPES